MQVISRHVEDLWLLLSAWAFLVPYLPCLEWSVPKSEAQIKPKLKLLVWLALYSYCQVNSNFLPNKILSPCQWNNTNYGTFPLILFRALFNDRLFAVCKQNHHRILWSSLCWAKVSTLLSPYVSGSQEMCIKSYFKLRYINFLHSLWKWDRCTGEWYLMIPFKSKHFMCCVDKWCIKTTLVLRGILSLNSSRHRIKNSKLHPLDIIKLKPSGGKVE